MQTLDGLDSQSLETLLIEQGLITKEQLARAQRILSKLENPRPISEVIVELGLVKQAVMDEVLRNYRKGMKIGAILKDKGLVDDKELDIALTQQKLEPDKKLGEVLMDMGVVDEKALLETLCEKHDIPFVTPDITQIDRELLSKTSTKYLKRRSILPISIKEDEVTIATPDPLNTSDLEDLQRIFRAKVRLVGATAQSIQKTLEMLEATAQGVNLDSYVAKVVYHEIDKAARDDKVIELVDYIIGSAIKEGASDIHIEPLSDKLRVRFRVDGSLVHKTDFPKEYTPRITSRLKIMAGADIAERRKHQDGKIFVKTKEYGEVDIRASFYITVFGENIVLRILKKKSVLVGIQDVGFAPRVLRTYVDEVLSAPSGITLVTGPTGSGKTTTLYSSLDYCNDVTKKIITCEDPVEYVIDGISQCSINEKIGLTFDDTLKAIVRQDPDIIVLGEIRDRSSANMAIQSALTGHKVFATFHTEDSVGALLRLIDMQIETFLIASTVCAVLAQRLVRKICEKCRRDYVPPHRILRRLGLSLSDVKSFPLGKGRGCSNCNFTGYRGRTGIHELLVLNSEIMDAILRKLPSFELRDISMQSTEMCTLQEDGIVKVLKGITTFEEVLGQAPISIRPRPIEKIIELTGMIDS